MLALFPQNISMALEMHQNRVYIKSTPQEKIRQVDDHNKRKHGPRKHKAYLKLLKKSKSRNSIIDKLCFLHATIKVLR